MNTNTEQQIEQQLQVEFDKFYNSTYDGKISVPVNILDLFKKGVMALAPQFHKINSNKIKVVANKLPKELTIGDLKDIITIIVNTPFDKLYADFNEAITSNNTLQKFILSYNNDVEEFNAKLRMKKATLTELSRGVNPNNNGMKIVN